MAKARSGKRTVTVLQALGGLVALYGGVSLSVENLDAIREGFNPFVFYGVVTAFILAIRAFLREERGELDWVFISAAGVGALLLFQEGDYRGNGVGFLGLILIAGGLMLLNVVSGPRRRPPFGRRASVNFAIADLERMQEAGDRESADGRQRAEWIRQLSLELQHWPGKWDREDDAGEYRFWQRPT